MMKRLSVEAYGRYAFAPLELQVWLQKSVTSPYGRSRKILQIIDDLKMYLCFFSDYRTKLCLMPNKEAAVSIFKKYGDIIKISELTEDQETYHMKNDYSKFII